MEESLELEDGGELGKGSGMLKTKRAHVKLPEWLKTDIPVSAGYNKIKDDLRGLGLHTGEFGTFTSPNSFPFFFPPTPMGVVRRSGISSFNWLGVF